MTEYDFNIKAYALCIALITIYDCYLKSHIYYFFQPMRACVLGPPASGKTTVIRQLCEHFKLHHIKIQDVINEAIDDLVIFLYVFYMHFASALCFCLSFWLAALACSIHKI